MFFRALGRAAVFLFIGIGMLITSFVDKPKPQASLKQFQGVAKDFRVETKKTGKNSSYTTQTLHFSFPEFHTSYENDEPHFKEIVTAIESKEPVVLLVEILNKEKGSSTNLAKLYQVSSSDKTLLDYSETVKKVEERNSFQFWIGLIFTAIGGIIAYFSMIGMKEEKTSSTERN